MYKCSVHRLQYICQRCSLLVGERSSISNRVRMAPLIPQSRLLELACLFYMFKVPNCTGIYIRTLTFHFLLFISVCTFLVIHLCTYFSCYSSLYVPFLLFIYVRTFLVIHLCTYLSCYSSLYVPFLLFIYVRTFLVIHLCTYLSCYSSMYVPFLLFISVRTFLVIHLCTYLSCYLSLYLSLWSY